jgi:SAM-dependent methyltransferase
MTLSIWLLLGLAGALFAAKMLYVLSTALALPITRGALYVSTSGVRISAFLNAVPMEARHLLVDLGCGSGKVLQRAHRRYGMRAVGYEVNPLAYLRARLNTVFCRDVTIRAGSFWRADLSQADVVFCYLFPDVMADLAAKLTSELKPGAVVVSCNFPLPGWPADRVLRPGSGRHSDPIFIYRRPHRHR